MKLIFFNICLLFAYVAGQRITTIQLDGVQYFVSRMNPYSPELNYFLAYQYCRSLGLQLASFESKEKAESMSQYLQNAGYSKYDFWTSGNRLGTGMFLWMSTGLPFNATFEYFEDSVEATASSALDPLDHNSNTSPQRTARDSGSGLEKGCVMLKAPTLRWAPEDCSTVKDFICEQTRCYYYNYGSIPVSSAQGRPITTVSPQQITSTTQLPPSSTLAFKEPILLSSFSKRIGLPAKEKVEKIEKVEKVTKVKPAEPIVEDVETEVDSNEKVKSESEEHDEIESVEEEQPLEKRLKQISEEVEKFNNNENEHDIGRQSFFSLSDLIKTLRPNDKKTPQIDSDYSNTMRVLGETLLNDEGGRNLKDSDIKTAEITS